MHFAVDNEHEQEQQFLQKKAGEEGFGVVDGVHQHDHSFQGIDFQGCLLLALNFRPERTK